MTRDRNGTELKVGDLVRVPLVHNNEHLTTWSTRIIGFFRDGKFIDVEWHDRYHHPVHVTRLCEKVEE